MRLGDLDALKEQFNHLEMVTNNSSVVEQVEYKMLMTCISLIDNAPTVEAVPLEHHNKIKAIMNNEIKSLVDILDNERPQGEWIFRSSGYYKCSNCSEVERAEKNYCSNCGAKMKGSAE